MSGQVLIPPFNETGAIDVLEFTKTFPKEFLIEGLQVAA